MLVRVIILAWVCLSGGHFPSALNYVDKTTDSFLGAWPIYCSLRIDYNQVTKLLKLFANITVYPHRSTRETSSWTPFILDNTLASSDQRSADQNRLSRSWLKTQVLKVKTNFERHRLEPTSKMKQLFDITLFLSLFATGVSLKAVANENGLGGLAFLRAGSRRTEETCDSISKFASVDYNLDYCVSRQAWAQMCLPSGIVLEACSPLFLFLLLWISNLLFDYSVIF